MAIPVGVSELPGRTMGVTQVMSNEQAGRQLVAAIAELCEEYGIIVTINEADRPRPVQVNLRAAYEHYVRFGSPWAALAAWCSWGPPPQFTSTHDPDNYGNAADLGGPGGTVISDAAVALLDAEHPDGRIGKKYGIVQTGKHFSSFEKWHFNIYPERAQLLVPADNKTITTLPPVAELEEDDMATTIVSSAIGKTVVIPGAVPVLLEGKEADSIKSTAGAAIQRLSVPTEVHRKINSGIGLSADRVVYLILPSRSGKGGGYALYEDRKMTAIGQMDAVNGFTRAGAPVVRVTQTEFEKMLKELKK